MSVFFVLVIFVSFPSQNNMLRFCGYMSVGAFQPCLCHPPFVLPSACHLIGWLFSHISAHTTGCIPPPYTLPNATPCLKLTFCLIAVNISCIAAPLSCLHAVSCLFYFFSYVIKVMSISKAATNIPIVCKSSYELDLGTIFSPGADLKTIAVFDN